MLQRRKLCPFHLRFARLSNLHASCHTGLCTGGPHAEAYVRASRCGASAWFLCSGHTSRPETPTERPICRHAARQPCQAAGCRVTGSHTGWRAPATRFCPGSPGTGGPQAGRGSGGTRSQEDRQATPDRRSMTHSSFGPVGHSTREASKWAITYLKVLLNVS